MIDKKGGTMAESLEVISHGHQSVEALSPSTGGYYAAVAEDQSDREVAES